jgi:hypothetical protein
MSEKRCVRCGWPLATSARDGCRPKSCAFRPHQPSPEQQRLATFVRCPSCIADTYSTGCEDCPGYPAPPPDPRDARVAELEAEVARLRREWVPPGAVTDAEGAVTALMESWRRQRWRADELTVLLKLARSRLAHPHHEPQLWKHDCDHCALVFEVDKLLATPVNAEPPAPAAPAEECVECGGRRTVWRCSDGCPALRPPPSRRAYRVTWCQCLGTRVPCPRCGAAA